MRAPAIRIYEGEIVVDNFAGGGGASTGITHAIGRSPDIAINHDPEAIAMHRVNHPTCEHYCEDVWDIDPEDACRGRKVALAWFSPDCKHFSKAKGGKPVDKKIRGLAWVAVRWARAVRPRVIMLENVEEFRDWGPIADDGRPCPLRRGLTYRRFVAQLRNLGYQVEDREIRACDHGAPTTRKRLFLIARCDGEPIVWPDATHGKGREPYRTAAECIDWNLPCPSIFERDRPLAENTQRRIAEGIRRFVLEAPQPFIVGIDNASNGARDAWASSDPLRTITAENRFAVVAPTLIQTGYGEREGQAPRVPGLNKPLGTAVAGGVKHALVAAFLAKHNGIAEKMVVGQDLSEPVHTITAKDQKAVVTSHLLKLYGTSTGCSVEEPMPTITAGGQHIGEVRAFLMKYYSTGGQWQSLFDPVHTIRTKDGLALVMVHGEPHVIADIGMRMLSPRELYRAQGFPSNYVIDHGMTEDGEKVELTKTAQVRMVGNSVSPNPAEALVAAQFTAGRQGTGRAAA